MSRRPVRFALLCSLLVLASAGGSLAAGVDWPGFRGPNSDGAVPAARLFNGDSPALTVGWKRELGSGYSALAVGDGRAVTMFAAGDVDVLAAFEVGSGDEIWRYRIADTYNGHDGSHDGPISTPLMMDGRVYGLGAWGDLFAVDAATGKEIWKTHLVEDHDAEKPYYGFTTSPVLASGMLVVEIGAKEGKAIAGFAADSGKLVWTAGDDTIEYHSPIIASIGGRQQVVAVGKDNIYGLDAESGDVLWTYKHEGDERAMGGMTIVPVPAGDDRLFLMNKIDSSMVLSVKRDGVEYVTEELWSGNAIKSSYVTPVHHDGYLYGMSNRIFTCIDASTGEIQWRSREPGDGFPTVVGEHLVVITKPGSLHVAKASPEGYQELARLDLFDEHSWSEVAFAGGHLYARSMAHLARIDLGGKAEATGRASVRVTGSRFGRFLDEVEEADDKTAVIDSFLSRQSSFPIVEGPDVAHFVYRGEAEDVGIVSDVIGFRREDPMTRVEGTDLFYYTMRIEPDAAATYGFMKDYEEATADPLNPRPGVGLFGEVSWFAMPAWEEPSFLGPTLGARQGRLETVEWESIMVEAGEDDEDDEGDEDSEEAEPTEPQQRSAQVYLPAGYDAESGQRYPTLYVHGGKFALEQGEMKNALDHLIGSVVTPVIAVFIMPNEEDPRADRGDPYLGMIVNDLMPLIDGRYATIQEPWARASIGAGRSGGQALQGAFKHPELFGRVGTLSPMAGVDDIEEYLASAEERPLVVYLQWGTYHMRSPHEAWSVAEANRELWTALREHGYRPAGGEVPEGYGWMCWRAHTDELLAALYPVGS